MAILEILKFPDPRLRHKAKPVESVTPQLQQLADNMLETMYESKGIGLAAIQVNEPVRLLVIDTRPINKEGARYEPQQMTEREQKVDLPLVVFNPVIVKKEGKTTYDEGCLSVPGYYETVQRFDYVKVEYLNREGEKSLIELDGLLSICIQHEMDHLDGKLFIDRLSPIKSNRIKSRIKKHGYPEADEDDESTTKKGEEVAL